MSCFEIQEFKIKIKKVLQQICVLSPARWVGLNVLCGTLLQNVVGRVIPKHKVLPPEPLEEAKNP